MGGLNCEHGHYLSEGCDACAAAVDSGASMTDFHVREMKAWIEKKLRPAHPEAGAALDEVIARLDEMKKNYGSARG